MGCFLNKCFASKPEDASERKNPKVKNPGEYYEKGITSKLLPDQASQFEQMMNDNMEQSGDLMHNNKGERNEVNYS
jgi:hypothetical protein